MKRRDVISFAGGAAASSLGLPLLARAQQPALPVVGFLGFTASASELVTPFLEGLAKAGFSDGRNVAIQYRWAHDQADRLPALVADLLRQQVAVIVTIGGAATARAAMAATRSVPVVFEVGRDPVATGLVASLNRPGGNATGVYMLTGALNGKRLEMLHEMVPRAATIAVLIRATDPAAVEAEVRAAAVTVGVHLHIVRVDTERDFVAAFTALSEKRIGALVVTNNAYFNSQRAQLVALTERHALPAIFEWREFVASGGLMSYGADLSGVLRELGDYAGRVLMGTKPADLPIAQSTRFALVINLKTARALGLTIPQSVLLRADEVIQ
jgi:putative ABC transport system substrate-binding protein